MPKPTPSKSGSVAAKPRKSAARAAPPVARKIGHAGAISMRELQKMSAAAIEALPHAVPVKSGDRTVAILSPFRRIPEDGMREIESAIETARQARSKEIDARLAAYLGEPVEDIELTGE